MKKIFKIKNLVAFDLLRVTKDQFYDLLDQEYKKQFNKDIEIIEADINLIKDGVQVKITTFKQSPF